MASRVLILFAHPALEKSRVNRRLIAAVQDLENVTINDLYEQYPDFYIHVKREQELLLSHDVIVFQHPFYWYSCPALVKQWEDLVLQYGFAYGEYRHELESDIEPFKGLLLCLFFVSVGASIDLHLLTARPLLISGLLLGLLAVKFLLLLCIGKVTKLEKSQNFTFAFALAQGGEFAFVLIAFAVQNDVLEQRTGSVLVATVALSMVAAPFLFTINDRFVQPWFSSRLPEREADEIDEKDKPVILAGFGRFGHIVGRVLHLQGIQATVLDLDAEQVELVRKLGIKVFYGDASRHGTAASCRRGKGETHDCCSR
jgi:hypothetical protein